MSYYGFWRPAYVADFVEYLRSVFVGYSVLIFKTNTKILHIMLTLFLQFSLSLSEIIDQ